LTYCFLRVPPMSNTHKVRVWVTCRGAWSEKRAGTFKPLSNNKLSSIHPDNKITIYFINRSTVTVFVGTFDQRPCVQIFVLAFTYHSCSGVRFVVHAIFYQISVVYRNEVFVNYIRGEVYFILKVALPPSATTSRYWIYVSNVFEILFMLGFVLNFQALFSNHQFLLKHENLKIVDSSKMVGIFVFCVTVHMYIK